MKPIHPQEFKVMSLRDCPVPGGMLVCETSQQVADYWRLHIATTPQFNPECECLAVLILNTRRRVKGHQLLTIGTMDTILGMPAKFFAEPSSPLRHPSPSSTIIRAVTRSEACAYLCWHRIL